MHSILLALWLLYVTPASAAPVDDGQTAGARTWTLSQARSGVAVTPNDGTDLAIKPTRYLYNGNATACTIVLRMIDDGANSITLVSVQPGALLPLQVARVLSTSTTCTTILAFY